jgi:oxygen-independent coproporphyrinogen III oxidase
MVAGDDLKREYMKALVKEIEYYSDLVSHIETIYIGGGTPSSLDKGLLEAFLDELSLIVNLNKVKEFTIEVNPSDVDDDLIKLLKKYQINRVSMGVQSIDDELLKFLGRTHNHEIVEKALSLLKKAEFNLNLDFLYAIPGQSKEQLNSDINFIKKFQVEHISYYSLIVEDKTILSYLINNHKIADFSDDLARDYGEFVDKSLADMGYIKYEFSNYAKPNFESKHNLLYWNLEEYLGVGLNASSQYNYVRMKNPRKIKEYIEGTKKFALVMHELEEFNPKLEILLMGLRKTKGVSLDYYKSKIRKDVFSVYPQLKKHLDNKLLEIVDGYLRFTRDGMYLSNQVYLDII